MHYFIDGYNVLFRTLRARGNEDLKYERLNLIHELAEKIKAAGIEATIIFDSHYQVGERTRHFFQTLDIHFTDHNQTADAFIVEALHKLPNPRSSVVVTSDQHLAWHARSAGAESMSVDQFKKTLNRIYLKKKTLNIQNKPKPLPTLFSKTQVETTQERYERIFSENLDPTQTTPHKKMPLKKLEIKEVEEKDLSDFERWLRIFENGA